MVKPMANPSPERYGKVAVLRGGHSSEREISLLSGAAARTAMIKPMANPSPERYGKAAVLRGGHSSEREISLLSGAAVAAALRRRGVDASEADVDEAGLGRLLGGEFDRAFIALHGRGGEDGVIQGFLETLCIPYTGSGVAGSALAMDKVRCKQLWQSQGLPTPRFRLLRAAADLEGAPWELGLPLMVKPSREGSSYGAAKVETTAALEAAWRNAAKYDEDVICEEWLSGGDYTVSLLDGEALPAIKIETVREFYDYQAKYLDDDTRYLCPCGLPEARERELADLARRAFAAAGGSGWGRVDVLADAAGRLGAIDVNTVPGMTSHSLVPQAAQAAGIDFDELALRILETSMARRRPAAA